MTASEFETLRADPVPAPPPMVRLTSGLPKSDQCQQLGPFVCETGSRVTYRTRNGVAFIPKRFIHLEPCIWCKDHQRRQAEDFQT